MNTFELSDLMGSLEGLAPKVRQCCPAADAVAADNIESFVGFFKGYCDTFEKFKLDAASDQLALILDKSDGTQCDTMQTTVMIILEANQGLKSHSEGDHARVSSCVQSAINQLQRF